VSNKRTLIAVAVAASVALWLFSGREEPPPPAEPAAQRPSRPPPGPPSRQAPAAQPRFDYAAPRPPQGWQPDAGRSAEGDWARGEGEYADPAFGWSNAPNYRFRPLTEGDRRRMGSPEVAPYGSARPQAAMPPSNSWADGRYRFRTAPGGEGATGRYASPYEVPQWGTEGWSTDPDYAEKWDLPPMRESGPRRQPYRAPPGRQMYPSLDGPSNRSFTSL